MMMIMIMMMILATGGDDDDADDGTNVTSRCMLTMMMMKMYDGDYDNWNDDDADVIHQISILAPCNISHMDVFEQFE